MSYAFSNPTGRSRRTVVRAAALASLALPFVAAEGLAQLSDSAVGMSAADPKVAQAGRVKPFALFSASALATRDSLVKLARAQVGLKYVMGGASPERGFDCSGLVKYVMAALKLDAPRTAARQAGIGTSIGLDTARLKPGDLLAFGRGRAASHVGIYVGNGRYVHASSVAGRVIESDIARPKSPLVKRWRDTRRVVDEP